MIRLGLIADTHFPTRIPTLPYEALEEAFRDVDAILHAGDVESEDVLDHLAGIAPVQAVRGDDDPLHLPQQCVLQFGDVRVGLIHGHRHPVIEGFFRMRRRLGKRRAGSTHLLNSLPRRFAQDTVDVIVFGHLHRPLCIEHDGVLLVNPGAVYALTPESAQWQLLREQNPLRRKMLTDTLRRFQRHMPPSPPLSTVGILEIDENQSISAHIVELPHVAYN